MKKFTVGKEILENQIARAYAAISAGEPVYHMDGKQYVEGQIVKIDPDNLEFMFLLKLSKNHMKWVAWYQIAFGVKKEGHTDE